MYEEIPTPGVVVELDILEANIRKMNEGARKAGISLRPHMKAHRSAEIAKMQLAAGAAGITCAKLGEAEVMAEAGIRDILIAFPLIGRDKWERLGRLMEKARVTTIVNSLEGARGLSELGKRLERAIPVLIEVDGGIHRGGRRPGEDTAAFAEAVRGFGGIRIQGILYYGGTIYTARNREEVLEKVRKERTEVMQTAGLLAKRGFSMEVLSSGSSFSSKCPEQMKGVTELRPGHYVFNDCGQLAKGFAGEEDCALRVAATVVCVPDERHCILDAGSKVLTTDETGGCRGYGRILGREDLAITKLNEEHGFVACTGNIGLCVGEKLAIIPNHACVVPNLVDKMYGMRKGRVDHMICVDARGRSQ